MNHKVTCYTWNYNRELLNLARLVVWNFLNEMNEGDLGLITFDFMLFLLKYPKLRFLDFNITKMTSAYHFSRKNLLKIKNKFKIKSNSKNLQKNQKWIWCQNNIFRSRIYFPTNQSANDPQWIEVSYLWTCIRYLIV